MGGFTPIGKKYIELLVWFISNTLTL